ncbi:MAG: ribonuclease H-like domain-containing protein, partial [Lachnospiraceae bacterium]|nr:ribonuclease H-like domain-containing protein [Lachnospiraceae bacterium]
MIQISKKYPYTKDDFIAKYLDSESLMYDIETTGFSRKHCTVYLIGCAYIENDDIIINQFFAENPDEEINVLKAFIDLSKNFTKVITFNGIAFDQPFIYDRCKHHKLEYILPIEHIDLFRICSSCKKVLNLASYNQKSIESFLGLHRDDLYNGGQLIDVYNKYVSAPTDEALELLLLHNHDDVKGMTELIPIITYRDFVDEISSIESYEIINEIDYSGSEVQELIIKASLNITLPKPFNIRLNNIYIQAEGNKLTSLITLYQGELKHFIKDYKKYYYLPDEDMIVLKEMAYSIPNNRKVKAKASTCYMKKSGLFLPVSENLQVTDNVYSFYEDISKSQRYLIMNDDFDNTFYKEYLI